MITVETILSLAVLLVSCGCIGLMFIVHVLETKLSMLSYAYFELHQNFLYLIELDDLKM